VKKSKKSYLSEKDDNLKGTAPHIKGLYLLFVILTVILVSRIVYLKAKPSEYNYENSDKDFSVYTNNSNNSNTAFTDSLRGIDSLETDSLKTTNDSWRKNCCQNNKIPSSSR